MTHKALTVTLDDSIVPAIDDTLASLGHEHERATNQHEARCLLKANEYSYVLLDLEIPARPRSPFLDRVYGNHLLEYIQQIKGQGALPVIVMDSEAICMNYVMHYVQTGASDFTSKPIQCRILAKVIRRMLRAHNGNRRMPQGDPTDRSSTIRFDTPSSVIAPHGRNASNSLIERRSVSSPTERFAGGELVFVKDRHGCECLMDELIGHDEQGYYLRDWIVIRERVIQEKENQSHENNIPRGTTDEFSRVPAGSIALESRWNERQQWVINELRQGTQVQRFMIQEEFGVGEKTAKRDLAELTQASVIEYVRTASGGYYRLWE